jgi:hypothetical protein
MKPFQLTESPRGDGSSDWHVTDWGSNGLGFVAHCRNEATGKMLCAAPEVLEELCSAREWLDELCGLIQSGMFDAASDWVGANAVAIDSTLAAAIAKATGEPVMAA